MSIQESKVYVGVDVASKHLDLFFPDTGKSERIKNDAEEVKALCVRIQGQSQYMFVMEASGGYPSEGCVPTVPSSVSPCAIIGIVLGSMNR